MEAYVFPFFGDVPVSDVTTDHVLEALLPIWFSKPETAKRVLQRIEAVFKSAILRGSREKASPCVGVADHLGTRHREQNHHAALPVFDHEWSGTQRLEAKLLAGSFNAFFGDDEGRWQGKTLHH